jgi:phage shock protein PspC (stress-responsive transcriptional regulator)/energy-converting hydrogenase Eha subunit E
MTHNTEFAPPAPTPPAPRPPLRRSESDKVLAGVAGGFARWLEIDPVIVRVVLVILAVFGGSGLLLYVIGWLFIPTESAPASEAEKLLDNTRKRGSTTRTVLLVVAIVIGVIIFANIVSASFGRWGGGGSLLLVVVVAAAVVYLINRKPGGQRAVVPPPPPAMPVDADGEAQYEGVPPTVVADLPPPTQTGFAYGGQGTYPGYVYTPPAPKPPKRRSYLGLATFSLAVVVTGILTTLAVSTSANLPVVVILATALGILGLGLVIGAFAGRARWLTFLAVPLLILTALLALVPSDISHRIGAGVGDKVWAPVNTNDLAVKYEWGIGTVQPDLTNTAIPLNSAIGTSVRLAAGDLKVIVPSNAKVVVRSHVGAGQLTIDSQDANGFVQVEQQNGRDLTFNDRLPGGKPFGPTLFIDASVNVGNVEVSRA